MILAMTPFAPDLNLGAAYNAAMDLLPEDGWACLLDHDAAFTTTQWHRQLEEAIALRPEGTFTGVTNRIYCEWQQAREAARLKDQPFSDDMAEHRKIGQARLKIRTLLDATDASGWGGFLMCLSKKSWRAAGGFADGLFCVDHMMHYALRAAGRRVYCVEGLYIYHWRGSSRDRESVRTFPKAKDCKTGASCPCRSIGKVAPPTERIILP